MDDIICGVDSANVKSRLIQVATRLQLVVVAIVFSASFAYAADDNVNYFGYLPGDHHEQDPEWVPIMNVPETMHGTSTYFGWTSTNNFVRNFLLSYDMLSVKGEPKHGLWKWTVQGTDPEAPKIWWCELGGSVANNASNGHVDVSSATSKSAGQSGMEPVWEMIREMHKVNKAGPKAVAAKLSSIAQTYARVYLAPGANVWGNVGTESQPFYEIINSSGGQFEWYVFEAYYNRNSQKFSTKSEIYGTWSPDQPCKAGVSEAEQKGCVHLHSIFAAIASEDVAEGYTSLTSWGLHYGPDVGACPSSCGAGTCDCDRILADVSLDGYLGAIALDDPMTFLPSWALGAPTPAGLKD